MDKDERAAIAELCNMDDSDPEAKHGEADQVLLTFLEKKGYVHIVSAYRETRDRIGFLYA